MAIKTVLRHIATKHPDLHALDSDATFTELGLIARRSVGRQKEGDGGTGRRELGAALSEARTARSAVHAAHICPAAQLGCVGRHAPAACRP